MLPSADELDAEHVPAPPGHLAPAPGSPGLDAAHRSYFGAVLAMKARLEDAATEFLAAARLAPQSSLPLVALALVEIERKHPEKAIELLRECCRR